MSPSPLEPFRRAARAAITRRVISIVLVWVFATPLLFAAAFAGAWGLGMLTRQSAWGAGLGFFLGPALVTFLAYKLTRILDARPRFAEREYVRQYRETLLAPAFAGALSGCQFDPAAAIDPGLYQGSGLFRSGFTAFPGFGRFTGEAAGCGFTGCLLDVSEARTRSSSSSQTRIPHFRGLFAILDRPAPVLSTVLLVDPAYQEEPGRAAALVRRFSTGDPAFDTVFWTCIGDGNTAAPALPQELRDLLLDLRTRLNHALYVSLTPRAIHLAIPNGAHLPVEPSLLTPINSAALAEGLRHLELLLKTLRALAACPW